MFLRTVGRSFASIAGKRGLAVAAAVAASQFLVPRGAQAIADPSSLFSSCYESTVGLDLKVYAYAQWDASPYSSGDTMTFYFGVSSTTIGSATDGVGSGYAWRVYTSAGNAADEYEVAADQDSASFFPYDYQGTLPDYVANSSYEMGFQANSGDDDVTWSNVTWCGCIQNT